MPLDTRPQTPGRQALLLGVLLLFFLASLGFAQFLVKHPKAPEHVASSLRFTPPQGFALQPKSPSFGGLEPAQTYAAQVHGARREIYVFEVPGKPGGGEVLYEKALALYSLLTRGHGGVPMIERSVLAGAAAVDLRGQLKGRPGFVMLRAAFAGNAFVAVAYTGDTGETDADTAIFNDAIGPGDDEHSDN